MTNKFLLILLILIGLFVYWALYRRFALYLILKSLQNRKGLKFKSINTAFIKKMNEKLIFIGVREVGVTEDAGTALNDKRILQYNKDIGTNFSTDEIPWCSVYVNWVALKAGAQRSKSAMARSWLNIGTPVKEPQTGDVVIFQRNGNPSQGHVGFYISDHEDGKRIYVLGGNQGNQVNISPFSKADILGYRRLNAA